MKAEIDSINTIGGVKFWGIRFFNEEGKRVATYNIRLHDMKKLGVVNRLGEKSKLIKWLNSEEGQTWLQERMKTPNYSLIGAFI